MAAFKESITSESVARLAAAFKKHDPKFRGFRKLKLGELELKDRVRLVAQELRYHYPETGRALSIIRKVAHESSLRESSPFLFWPLFQYIEDYGLKDFEDSLETLRICTQVFTGEFAIRPFLQKDPQRVMKQLQNWVKDPNYHVRRLVSEGTRPFLPWGIHLTFVRDRPDWTLSLLQRLWQDPELYVRKSVANHLNDISKFHPDLVVRVLSDWSKQASSQEAQGVVRHALRTLIKRGHKGALALLGIKTSAKIQANLRLREKRVCLGDSLGLSATLCNKGQRREKVLLDYVIYLLRANGLHSAKVFKGKTLYLEAGQTIEWKKRHKIVKVTTRAYYPGRHFVALKINGQEGKRRAFDLSL